MNQTLGKFNDGNKVSNCRSGDEEHSKFAHWTSFTVLEEERGSFEMVDMIVLLGPAVCPPPCYYYYYYYYSRIKYN